MKAVAAASALVSRQALLTRALRDPKVENLARSMNVDLRDPKTFDRLLKQAHDIVGATRVTLSAQTETLAADEDVPVAVSTQLARISEPRARGAIRAYLEIAALE